MTTSGSAPRRQRGVGGPDLGQSVSAEARRLGAAILEVLAGARTPTEAATALSLSLPRYYQLEVQALRGLLAACERRPRGPGPSPERAQQALRLENQRLQRELTRQQSLARAAQRAVGLAPPAPPAAAKAGKKTRKRRVARALSVAARLQTGTSPTAAVPAPAEATRAAPP
jgi:hypothetical protein